LAEADGGLPVRFVKAEWGSCIFHRKAITLLVEGAMI